MLAASTFIVAIALMMRQQANVGTFMPDYTTQQPNRQPSFILA